MPPRRVLPPREPVRPRRRELPEPVPDVESVQQEQQEERSPPRMRRRSEIDGEPEPPAPQREDETALQRENETLRAENRALRDRQEILELREQVRILTEERARNIPQVAPEAPPAPAQPAVQRPRGLASRTQDDEGVSITDFLKLQTPKFSGDRNEDPQDFMDETEKMVQTLTCSDTRIITLVGIKLKKNAWDWFRRNVQEQLYGENPPTWEVFKQALIDEFISPYERQNRALQFERLKQSFGMSVDDYSNEFLRLCKYATVIVPTEAARMERYKQGLIPSLYAGMATIESPNLSRLIDKTRQLEAKFKEGRVERDRRKKGRGQSSRGRDERSGFQYKQTEQTTQSSPQGYQRGRPGRNRNQGTSVFTTPGNTHNLARTGPEQSQAQGRTTCPTCGRYHKGTCRSIGFRGCFRCCQQGHFIKDCPLQENQPTPPTISQITVQMERPTNRGPTGRGRPQGPAPTQNTGQPQTSAPVARGQGRVFAVNPQEAEASNTAIAGNSI